MDFNEMLDVMEYGIKHYYDEFGFKFSLLEYYALTNINPSDLIKKANLEKKRSVAVAIGKFYDRKFLDKFALDIDNVLDNIHVINSKELTREDKILIITTLVNEEYPLMRGIYNMAARYYATYGIESIKKDNVKTRVQRSYFDYNYSKLDTYDDEKAKKLIKR